ncbi:MAG: hypothetical protein K2M22_10830, partial [Lachnospiraceae bacterium]|nr:hypothetical protein [Lachnospiraceae bacterium]
LRIGVSARLRSLVGSVMCIRDCPSSIQRRVKEATGIIIPKPVYYSAEYGYNLKVLFDFIVDHIPDKRRRMNRLP